MSIFSKITQHHKDERDAVEDAEETQKVRVSAETRIKNYGKLIREHTPDCPKQHSVLAKLHDLRVATEDLLNEVDEKMLSKEDHDA